MAKNNYIPAHLPAGTKDPKTGDSAGGRFGPGGKGSTGIDTPPDAPPVTDVDPAIMESLFGFDEDGIVGRELDEDSPLRDKISDEELVNNPENASTQELREYFRFSTEPKGEGAPSLTVAVGRSRFYMNPDAFNESHPELADLDVEDKKNWCARNSRAAKEEEILVPSITNVLGIKEKGALMPAALKEAALEGKAFVEKCKNLADNGDIEGLKALLAEQQEPVDKWKTTAFEKTLKTAARVKWDEASSRGTTVHAGVENLSMGKPAGLSPDYDNYMNSYSDFLADHPHYEYVATELTVVGDGYMGTTDAIVRDKRDKKLYVVDYKTKGMPKNKPNDKPAVYTDVGLQLAAAANGLRAAHSDGTTSALPKISGGIVLALGSNGKYNAQMFNTTECFEGFQASQALWKYDKKASSTMTALS